MVTSNETRAAGDERVAVEAATVPVALPSVHITYDHDPAERTAASLSLAARTMRGWRRYGLYIPAALVVLGTAAVFAIDGGLWEPAMSKGGMPKALPFVMLCLSAFSLWFAASVHGDVARGLLDRDPITPGLQHRSVDAAGFHVHAGDVRIDVPWETMSMHVETDEGFVFGGEGLNTYFLPKRALDAAQVEMIRALADLGTRAAAAAADAGTK